MLRLLCIYSLLLLAGCNKKNTPGQTPSPLPGPGGSSRVVNVSTAAGLNAALLDARPGDEIVMADGVYKGKFVIAPNVNGTATKPVLLRGSRNVILDAQTTTTGYVLHLQAS